VKVIFGITLSILLLTTSIVIADEGLYANAKKEGTTAKCWSDNQYPNRVESCATTQKNGNQIAREGCVALADDRCKRGTLE
jgi:hypothetical protein